MNHRRFYSIPLFLTLLVVLLLGVGGAIAPAQAAPMQATSITFTGAELLGRPTDDSVTINIVPSATIEYKYEYGTSPGVYTAETALTTATANQPHEVVISGLQPNTRYYYRMRYHAPGDLMDDWVTRDEHSFWTQRASGSTFTFTVTSDSHVNIMLGNASTWTQTMTNVANDHPDFLIDLGDTFAMDSVTTASGAESAYLTQRQYFDLVGNSAPIFLAPGNHEQQEGWHLDDTGNPATSPPVLGTNAEKKYYLNPVPDDFYSGNPDTYSYLDGDHLREDYYAWTWGDALFVVIDPFWYTMTKPYTGNTGGGESSDAGDGDRWHWTLGQEQFNWFKTTIANSTAKYKFVFAHHMVGGSDDYVRGGANPAHLVEWGGYNEAGTTYEWDTKRSGWGSDPIHQLLVANDVSAFFHGHDHQYAYEKRDGIVYQSLPAAGFSGSGFSIYSTGSGYTIQALPSPGHLRVTVSPSQATVDYVATTGGAVNYSYTIEAESEENDPPVVSDIPNQTIAEGGTFTTINLDNYVSDVDNADNELTWTYSGNTELAVNITDRVATITTPGTDWSGAETITFTATDPGALSDSDAATFTVTETPASVITYIGNIGTATIKDSGVASLVITTTAAVAAGDDIIIAYATDPTQDLTIAVTDSAGNKYQQVAMGISSGNLRTYIFAAYNVTALPSGGTITITQTVVSSTAVAARAAVVSVFRGLADSGALEQTSVGSQTGGTTPSSGAATTVQPVQLLIGAVGTEGPSGDTAGTWQNSFTEGPRAGTTGGTADTNITASMGWRIVSAAGSYTAAKSGITSRDSATAIATFKTTDAGISYIGDIGSAQTKASAGTSLAVTTNAAVASGDDILVTFAADPAATVSSVTDTAGNTYNNVVDISNSGNVRTIIFAAYNVSALPSGSAITINHASVTARSAVISVFRGLADSAVVDQTRTATGSSSSVSSGATGTTTQADELLIGAVGLEGPNYDAPSVWQNSFTYGPRLGTNYGSGSGGGDGDVTAQTGWRIVGVTGAYTAQIVNLNTARDWAAAIATFKSGPSVTMHDLTIAVDPLGSGIITPTVGVHTYADGTAVDVSATPAAGYEFDHWSGACTSTGTCQVTMDADKSVTAHFKATYDLTLAVEPVGSGTITPTVGVHTYVEGTEVDVTASPADGYVFDHWSGACTDSGGCVVTMDADKSVTAHFKATYDLTLAVEPVGSGIITPTVGVHTYVEGTKVDVTASPADGYVFDHWSGACTDSGGCVVTMDADKTVTAHFTLAPAGILGDVNDDSMVNSTDALIVLSCDAGIDTSECCPMNCGDVNGDGWVNSTDALVILSYDAGIAVPFPVEEPGCPASVTPCPGCNP